MPPGLRQDGYDREGNKRQTEYRETSGIVDERMSDSDGMPDPDPNPAA